MVSIPLSLATLALCSAAIVSDNRPLDDQLFTEFYSVTTTVHVGTNGPSVTTSPSYVSTGSSAIPTSKLLTQTTTNASAIPLPFPTSTGTEGIQIPADWLRFGVEVGAIHWANYRKTGVSHQEAVKLVRDGINLYIQQPPITDLINKSYKLVSDNFDSIVNKNITIPNEFPIQALRAFTDANEALLASPGFGTIDSYLRTNLRKFDLGSLVADAQNIVEINPAFAKKSFDDAYKKINENPDSAKAAKELASMAVKFANTYGLDGPAFQEGVTKLLSAIV